jgi:hypothetical protein
VRVVDGVTPEALFLTLYYGNGVLLLKSDEFKSCWDKFMVAGQNISAICSAHSGEPINYTTVKRGPLTIYESRLGIYGVVQPSLFVDMANGAQAASAGDQGLWERVILIPSDMDYDTEFEDQLTDMDEKDLFDIDEFLTSIERLHKEPQVYTCNPDAVTEIKKVKALLTEKHREAKFGQETGGLVSKAFSNLLKLCSIYSCIRQMVTKMEDDSFEFDFQVTAADVLPAWDLVKYSMNTFENYKIAIQTEIAEAKRDNENPMEGMDDETVLTAGLPKLIKIYERAVDNKIKVSDLTKFSLIPKGPGLNMDVFFGTLEKCNIARRAQIKSGNRKTVDVLELTSATESPETRRVFQLLFEQAKEKHLMFDPLDIFRHLPEYQQDGDPLAPLEEEVVRILEPDAPVEVNGQAAPIVNLVEVDEEPALIAGPMKLNEPNAEHGVPVVKMEVVEVTPPAKTVVAEVLENILKIE